jgi:tetratricopeptide (TPR) repeat protein
MTDPFRLALLSLSLLIPALSTAATVLHGQLVLVGTQEELTPAEGVMATLEETGDSERTKAGGLFNLPLPEAFQPGERITLQVTKTGWRIQYPLDGELRVPDPAERHRVDVRLLPVGSKKWWSDDRIEKFIADMAARAKEQITPDAKQQKPDFGRYIQEWAIQYGFSVEQAQAEIARWAAEVQQQQDDLYKLGLAAFAERHFGRAQQLFRDSAAANAKRMRQSEERIAAEQARAGQYREAAIRDYRLARDAAYNDYAFDRALEAYESALGLTDRHQRPQQWAEVTMDVAKAHYEIGIRTKDEAVQQNLAAAVDAYRAALEVYTLEHAAPYWLQTKRNLGVTLQKLGDLPGLAAVVEDLLRADTDNAELCNLVQSLYHETLFDFPAAERVTTTWLEAASGRSQRPLQSRRGAAHRRSTAGSGRSVRKAVVSATRGRCSSAKGARAGHRGGLAAAPDRRGDWARRQGGRDRGSRRRSRLAEWPAGELRDWLDLSGHAALCCHRSSVRGATGSVISASGRGRQGSRQLIRRIARVVSSCNMTCGQIKVIVTLRKI